MKRFFTAAILLFSALLYATAQSPGGLEEYLDALDSYPLEVKLNETDFIIGTAESAGKGMETAFEVYSHFRESKLMGDENIAVHVADKWILPVCSMADTASDGGKTCPLPDSTIAKISNFAEFNRASLLGEKAPLLPEAGLEGWPGNRKLSLLFFYDTGCAKCQYEIPRIEAFLAEHPGCGMDAFYTGNDETAWRQFIERFREADVRHFRDPDNKSDYIRKYSVTATPRLFLIDGDGIIVGRMLDSESLGVLVAEMRANEKQAVSELFDRLVQSRGSEAKEALEYVIDNYILCEDSVFNTAEDSLMVIGFARIQKDLLSRAAVGTKLPAIRVRGSLNGGKEKSYRLDRAGRKTKDGRLAIAFHAEGCKECEAEIRAAAEKGVNILTVNMDKTERDDAGTFSELMDAFDLSVLPFILECDRKSIITRRYISLQ